MAVAITNTLMAALNADQTLTYNAATVDTVNGTEVFTYTPTMNKQGKVLIGFVNGAGNGAFTYSIAKGNGVFQAAAALTGSIAAGATEVIQIEMGKYLNAGTIAITLTPASGKKLLSEHAANMWVSELI
jgi:hypothetical protein